MCVKYVSTLRHWGKNRQELSFITCLMEIIRERLWTFLGAWMCLIHCIIHGLSNLKLILKCIGYFTNFKIEINLILCWTCLKSNYEYLKQFNGGYRVQETDGSFFESYTAISWKLENRRLHTMQESREDQPPPPEYAVGIKPPPDIRPHPKEVSRHSSK